MDRDNVIKGLEHCKIGDCDGCPYDQIREESLHGKRDTWELVCNEQLTEDIISLLALLKEQEGLLGIQQTADSITFVSTGTAQQGEIRGLLLGKLAMHEWLKKELLYRGLLTDDIRAVFDEAERQ